jgi:hypothetical protein
VQAVLIAPNCVYCVTDYRKRKAIALTIRPSEPVSAKAIYVRRDSAVKLIDGLAGESPASAGYPVGTVVISGDGAGDQTVGSPDVNVLDGWTQVWSAPTGGQAKQQVVAKANRSQASKTHTSPESECEDEGNAETFIPS